MDTREIKEFLKDSLKYILTVVIVLVIFLYVISLQQVVGSSMSPKYEDRNVVLLNKINYKLFQVKRFDIISFKYNDTKYLIKRVIGLPGETIEYKNNILYVNGKAVSEDFLDDGIVTSNFEFEVIPDDKYLVLGDNRTDSLDSREIGFISKKDIIGKVAFKLWPLF